ncbi:MAG: monofunctional biosynthetic peptidoglycan transglycosylase [Krumholzibacteria bacterium]|nr:monofunctional biosynthetic peptidoglycan transglycosylase [Candidatus Krumholzibacteria bacterium]
MKRRLRILGLGITALTALAVLATCAQVLALRWHDPDATAWMRMRERQATERGRTLELRRTWLPLERIPRDLQRAVVLAEDGSFHAHHGFDWAAIRAARERNARAARVKVGGSTITQQLAKNLFLSPARTWVRKGRETVITAAMELLLPKDRILELYLNSIEFGPGVFGVAEAAQHHYGVPVERLTRQQCCRLAAIIPAPLRYRIGGDYVGRRAAQLSGMMGPEPAVSAR